MSQKFWQPEKLPETHSHQINRESWPCQNYDLIRNVAKTYVEKYLDRTPTLEEVSYIEACFITMQENHGCKVLLKVIVSFYRLRSPSATPMPALHAARLSENWKPVNQYRRHNNIQRMRTKSQKKSCHEKIDYFFPNGNFAKDCNQPGRSRLNWNRWHSTYSKRVYSGWWASSGKDWICISCGSRKIILCILHGTFQDNTYINRAWY